MVFYKIYLNSGLEIEPLAVWFRNIINCNVHNQTPWQMDQERDGLNYGGKYYLFEILNMELILVKHTGEIIELDFMEYDYFLLCKELKEIDDQLFRSCVAYISELLKSNDIDNMVTAF